MVSVEVLGAIFSQVNINTPPYFRTFKLKQKYEKIKSHTLLPSIWEDWENTQNIQKSPQENSVLKIENSMIDLKTEFLVANYSIKDILSPGGDSGVVYVLLGCKKDARVSNGHKVEGFNRKQDSEADYLGLIFSSLAGYDINESYKVWERMKEDMGGSGPSEFFSTHPSPDNRIKNLKEWIPIVSKQYPVIG